MGGLAALAREAGHRVTGCDAGVYPPMSDQLHALGIDTVEGFGAQQMALQPDMFVVGNVVSRARLPDGEPKFPLMEAILEAGAPYTSGPQWLAEHVLQGRHVLAVAGTHGKTTTSSLIGYVLLEAGLDPTIIVGGEVDAWEGNARLGQGRFLVAEADESDGSLTKHAPKIGVITNIELDHPDHYQNLSEVIDTFREFADQCQILVACLDCDTIAEHFRPTISYSLDPEKGADYTVSEIIYEQGMMKASVWEKGSYLGQMEVKIPGQHNISNALAVVAIGRYLGLEFAVIADAIATFAGAKRRFEHKGEANGITFIDDYAHHPSELLATLAAAKLKVEGKQYQRSIAIFQPHRYSRTTAFLEEFGSAFSSADVVVLTDIYSAGEVNINHVTGQQVAEQVRKHHKNAYYHPELSSLGQFLLEILQPGDLALFLGAGNLNQVIPEMLSHYREQLAVRV